MASETLSTQQLMLRFVTHVFPKDLTNLKRLDISCLNGKDFIISIPSLGFKQRCNGFNFHNDSECDDSASPLTLLNRRKIFSKLVLKINNIDLIFISKLIT